MGFMNFFGAKPNPDYKEEPLKMEEPIKAADQIDVEDDGVPLPPTYIGDTITRTFGCISIDSTLKERAPVTYRRIQEINEHIKEYAKVHELEGRIAELQKRCDEQSAIINKLIGKNQQNTIHTEQQKHEMPVKR